MARIVMGSTPLFGHVMPVRAVARDLVRRGYDVTVVTGSLFRERIAETGARFVPLRGNADFDPSRMTEQFPGLIGLTAGLEQLRFYEKHLFGDTIPAQYETLQEVLAEGGDEPVVMMQETCFQGLWPVLLGAPGIRPAAVIGLGITAVQISSDDTAPFGMGVHPDATTDGRVRNRVLHAEAREHMRPVQEALDDVLRSLGATETAPYLYDARVRLTDAYLNLSVPSYEYPRSDAPGNLRCVGALPPENRDVPLPPWWSEVTSAERVITVSQGLLSNENFNDLIRPTLSALADLDALVVATTGRRFSTGELGRIPLNARVTEYIPYEDLLPHVDVVVSNGGFAGVQQTLSHGVPMVLAGQSEDKMEVTAQAADTGAAVSLATDRPTQAHIRTAVDSVLTDPSYRRNALRLRAEYAAYEPYAAIAGVIENLTQRPAGGAADCASAV